MAQKALIQLSRLVEEERNAVTLPGCQLDLLLVSNKLVVAGEQVERDKSLLDGLVLEVLYINDCCLAVRVLGRAGEVERKAPSTYVDNQGVGHAQEQKG